MTAQSFSPVVVSSSGESYSNSYAQLSFTTGEMNMVETFSNQDNILTQGFQQSDDFGVFIDEDKDQQPLCKVFPNPGSGNFNFAIETINTANAEIIIYDISGKIIIRSGLFSIIPGSQAIQYNLNEFNNGIYLCEFVIIDDIAKGQHHFHQKIQLIK
jgi:hypothetical protein